MECLIGKGSEIQILSKVHVDIDLFVQGSGKVDVKSQDGTVGLAEETGPGDIIREVSSIRTSGSACFLKEIVVGIALLAGSSCVCAEIAADITW